jgi:hypothetical protein
MLSESVVSTVQYGYRFGDIVLQDFLGYANHLGLYTEEVSTAGEGCVW